METLKVYMAHNRPAYCNSLNFASRINSCGKVEEIMGHRAQHSNLHLSSNSQAWPIFNTIQCMPMSVHDIYIKCVYTTGTEGFQSLL